MADQSEGDARPASGRKPPSAKRPASLSPQTRERLAMQLRSMYDTVASQPVPDRFADLIAQLDAAEREK